jgi:hypothetical protein
MLTENQIHVTESDPGYFLISEEHPYFLPIRNTYINPNDCLLTTIGHSNDYKNEEFGKLLQTISSIGSCTLSKKIDAGVKQYFLGEKLRIRKCSYSIKEGALTAFAYPTVQTNRKGKAIIDIVDKDEILAYRFELDYNVFPQQTFEKLFKNYFRETTEQVLKEEMPATKNVVIDDSSFSIFIEKFSEAHCLGHFRNHPIVPAVFIVKCLLSGIKNWFSSEMKVQSDMIVDSLEIFPNRAMPIETELQADVKIQKLAPKIFMFICSIKDQNQTEYGVYPITIQI